MKLSKYLQKIPLNRLILIEIILGLLANVLSFFLFASLTQHILKKETIYNDEFISGFIYSLRTPLLTQIMKIITTVGNLPVFLGLTIIVFFFLIYKKHKFEALIFIIIITAGEALNFLLKILFQRPRPQLSPLLIQKDFSYPSGHAMNNLIIYGFIIFLFFRFTRHKKLSIVLAVVGAIWIGLIGFSRIYLGVHFPSDIAGGYLAGFWVLLTALLVDKTILVRGQIKKFV